MKPLHYKILACLVMVIGGTLMSWGIGTVGTRVVVPDSSVVVRESLGRLIEGRVFHTEFFKGGNLHVNLLTLIFYPHYNSLLPSGVNQSTTEIVSLVARNIDGFLLRARLLSLMAGLLGMYLVIRICRMLYTPSAGLLGGLLVGTNMLYVSMAHMGTEDMLAVSLMVLSFYFFLHYIRDGTANHLLGASISTGLAIGTKATTGVLLAPWCYLIVVEMRKEGRGLRAFFQYGSWLGLAYLFTTPSLVVFPREYLAGILQEISNRWSYHGFSSRYPGWITQILNLARSFSLPMFLLVLGFSVRECLRRPGTATRDRFHRLIALFLVPYFLIIGSWDTLNIYYVILLVPLLVIPASGAVIESLRNRSRTLPALLVILLVAGGYSAWYTATVVGQFPVDSRLQAKNYLRELLPDGAIVDVHSPIVYLPKFPDRAQVHSFPLHGKNAALWKDAERRLRSGVPDYVVMVGSHYERYIENPTTYPDITKTYRDLMLEEMRYVIIQTFGKEKILMYSLFTHLRLTWHPRALHPTNPTILILRRSRPPDSDPS